MTGKELAAACGFDVACGEGDREVTGGIYCCDLLSIVMGRAPADGLWVTVMGNLNSIAVAVLTDSACILLAEGMALDEDARLRGEQQDVTVLKTPLRDGDVERPDDEAYADSYFVNANSSTAPGIVDADRQPILDHSEVYSGVYGRASINFYAFNSNGNKGIACGLNNLQKIRDGEPLGGRSRAEDDFADEDEEDFLS